MTIQIEAALLRVVVKIGSRIPPSSWNEEERQEWFEDMTILINRVRSLNKSY